MKAQPGRRGKTWLVLRMDPQHNVAAVATRDSLASTFAAVTERLAEALDGRNFVARPLIGDELAEVDHATPQTRQRYATSFWLSPQDINSETLAQLWSADADATVLTIRVHPSGRRRSIGVGPLLQCQATAQRGDRRSQPAHRAPAGRGTRQPASPLCAPRAGRTGANTGRT